MHDSGVNTLKPSLYKVVEMSGGRGSWQVGEGIKF